MDDEQSKTVDAKKTFPIEFDTITFVSSIPKNSETRHLRRNQGIIKVGETRRFSQSSEQKLKQYTPRE
jgi:hypothetical protein